MYKAYSRYYMRDGLTRFSPGLVTRGLVVGADGVGAEESLASLEEYTFSKIEFGTGCGECATYNRYDTALGLASNLVADAGKSLALAWARRSCFPTVSETETALIRKKRSLTYGRRSRDQQRQEHRSGSTGGCCRAGQGGRSWRPGEERCRCRWCPRRERRRQWRGREWRR